MESLWTYQKVLDATHDIIVNAVPSPTTLLSYQQYQIFNAWEEERIKEEENERGCQNGTKLLLTLLRKKDQRAFDEFLRILQDPALQLKSLYNTLFGESIKYSECNWSGVLHEHLYDKGLQRCVSSESTTPYQNHVFSPDSFLKDMPPSIAGKLVRRLNVPDSFGKDWTGIADCLNLTHEQTLESSNKMTDMLDLMIQKHFKVKDLLQILKKLERYDVVELFTEDEKWLKTQEKFVQTEGLCNCANFGHVAPSHNIVSIEPENLPRTLNCSNCSNVLGTEDFLRDNVRKRAIIVANLNYNSLTKLDNLGNNLEDLKEVFHKTGWNVSCFIDCPWKELKSHLDNMMDMTKQSVVLLYYIGHSLQIYSANYLLPVDISIDDSRMDIVLKSINLSSFLQSLNQSLCSVVIIDSGYKTGLGCSEDFLLDGLTVFEPPFQSVVCLTCSPGHLRTDESSHFYIGCFYECLTCKPTNLATFLTEVAKKLTDSTCRSMNILPVVLSKTKDLLPITLNSKSEVILKPAEESFLVKKSALILVGTCFSGNNFKDTEVENLCSTLRSLPWEVRLVVNPSLDNVFKEVKYFLKQPDSQIKVVFAFGKLLQKKNENFLVLRNSSHKMADSLSQDSINIQWLVDLMCSTYAGHRVLILEDISSSDEVSLADINCPPQMLISIPRNGTKRKISTYFRNFCDAIQQTPTLGTFLDFMLTVGSRQNHKTLSRLFLL